MGGEPRRAGGDRDGDREGDREGEGERDLALLLPAAEGESGGASPRRLLISASRAAACSAADLSRAARAASCWRASVCCMSMACWKCICCIAIIMGRPPEAAAPSPPKGPAIARGEGIAPRPGSTALAATAGSTAGGAASFTLRARSPTDMPLSARAACASSGLEKRTNAACFSSLAKRHAVTVPQNANNCLSCSTVRMGLKFVTCSVRALAASESSRSSRSKSPASLSAWSK